MMAVRSPSSLGNFSCSERRLGSVAKTPHDASTVRGDCHDQMTLVEDIGEGNLQNDPPPRSPHDMQAFAHWYKARQAERQ